jgi:predicted nuclease of restriction endonuclease-like (RecB) superfamily
VELYWQIGEITSRKLQGAEWWKKLAQFIARTHPGLCGFTRANLFRMRQFYETYRQEGKVAPLVRQLSWSHKIVILGQTKRPEEREFYLRLAIAEGWSRRELERQMR